MEDHVIYTAMRFFYEDIGLRIPCALPGLHRSHITA